MRLPRAAVLRTHDADREILRLALPALGALIAEPLFLLADTAIVGRLGTPELAGLGIAATVLATFVNLSIFLAYGTTAAVARMLGAGDLRGALRQGVDGCWLALLIGVGSLLLGVPLTSWIVSLFSPTPEVADHAETYLRISLFGIPAMLLVLAATGVLRGLQDTRTPLLVAATGAAVNVPLNVVLVHGAGLGIAGSAIGTVAIQLAMAAVFAAIVRAGAHRHGTSLRPRWAGVRRSFGAGIPLLIRTLAMRVAFVVTTIVATALGTAPLAAHQIVFNTWLLLALVLDAVAIAAQALVGRALGAGDVGSARSITRRMIQWGVLAGFVLGLLLLAGGSAYARLFTADVEVRNLVVGALVGQHEHRDVLVAAPVDRTEPQRRMADGAVDLRPVGGQQPGHHRIGPAVEVEGRLLALPDGLGVRTDYDRSRPESRVELDRARAAAGYGVSPDQVAAALRTAHHGIEAGRMWVDGERVGLRLVSPVGDHDVVRAEIDL